MKKLYTLLVAGALVSGLSAQNVIEQATLGSSINLKSSVSINKTPTDTIAINPDLTAGGLQLNGWSSGGYVLGVGVVGSTPRTSKGSAQGYYMGYYFSLSSYKIEEVLLWCAAKEEQGTTTGNLTVNIQAIDDSSSYSGATSYSIACPGTVLGTGTIPWINIDSTQNAGSNLTVVPFATPVFVSADYAVGVDYSDIVTNQDTVGFVNNDGHITDDHQFFYYPGATTDFWSLYSHIVTGGWTKKASYWPVIDRSTGIEDAGFISGMKLAVSPNPAIDQVKVQYELSDNDNVTVQIFDLTGKVVYNLNEANVAAGVTNSVTVDVSDLSAGNYYVSLTANGERTTQKLVLTK